MSRARKARVIVREVVKSSKRPAWTPLQSLTMHRGVPVYGNSRYEVHQDPPVQTPLGRVVHLSVKQLGEGEFRYLRDWRDYQKIKNELVGPEFQAIELFPPEEHVVDSADQFHLWVLLDTVLPIGYFEGRRVSDTPPGGAGSQRPREEP